MMTMQQKKPTQSQSSHPSIKRRWRLIALISAIACFSFISAYASNESASKVNEEMLNNLVDGIYDPLKTVFLDKGKHLLLLIELIVCVGAWIATRNLKVFVGLIILSMVFTLYGKLFFS